MKIVSAVYSHPEYYPPTLNALNLLASEFDEVYCVHRNVKSTDLNYSDNIHLISSGKFKNIRATEISSTRWKIISFIQFALLLFKTIKLQRPKWIVLYDPLPLFAYDIIKFALFKRPKVWYHNHDVIELKSIRKYSLTHLAYLNEQKNINNVDIFSLPTKERKPFFKINETKIKYFNLPNYPSVKKIDVLRKPNRLTEPLKLIYQGHIGKGHGLTEMINFTCKSKLNIMLSIIGTGDENYIKILKKLIAKLNLDEKVIIHGFMSYDKLLDFSKNNHVGLAIHQPVNIAFRTAATASNKIYEYIALGMPVIVFDDENYRKALENFTWAKFTNLSESTTNQILVDIRENYDLYSTQAQKDFNKNLNFEYHFTHLLNELTK